MRFIYLASRYSRREELCDYRQQLVQEGHVITSRWLDTRWSTVPTTGKHEVSAAPPEEREKWVTTDVEDVLASTIMISFTCNKTGRGGRHVEYGIALARSQKLILIGEREHLFHYYPGVLQYDTWEQFWEDRHNALS